MELVETAAVDMSLSSLRMHAEDLIGRDGRNFRHKFEITAEDTKAFAESQAALKFYSSVSSSFRFGLRSSKRRSAQLFRIHSAPVSRKTDSRTVVLKAITLAPAALPARTPAGTSSRTIHSSGGNPRMEAPFK